MCVILILSSLHACLIGYETHNWCMMVNATATCARSHLLHNSLYTNSTLHKTMQCWQFFSQALGEEGVKGLTLYLGTFQLIAMSMGRQDIARLCTKNMAYVLDKCSYSNSTQNMNILGVVSNKEKLGIQKKYHLQN